MRSEYVLIAVTALSWGGYPLVARAAGNHGARGTLLLMVFGMVPIAVAALRGGAGQWPGGSSVQLLAVAGLMMGVGLLAFHALANSAMDASVSIPIVDIAMLLVSAIGAIVFLAEPVSIQKVAGIGLMLGGIAMLRPA